MRLAVGSSRRRWVAMWVATLSVWSWLLPAFPTVRPARAADGVWTQIPPPDYRLQASAVYDRVRHRMIVFGGLNGLVERNDVWVLELAYPNRWRRLQPTGTPPGVRRYHTAVYDPIQDRMIVFGGGIFDGSGWQLNNETWSLQLAGTPHWTQLTPSGTPPIARYGAVAVFDPARNRMLLHGGFLSNGSPMGDLWRLDLSGTPTWVQISPTTGIGPRGLACAVADSVRDRMVIMGGLTSNLSLGDTWQYPLGGGIWSEIPTIGAGPYAVGHAGAYDPLHDQLVVFGGADAATQTYLQGAWRLRFGTATPTWSRGPLTGAVPPPMAFASAVYDPIADALRIFGGWGGHPSTVSQDVWTLWLHPSPNWGAPLPSNAPPATGRQGAAAAYDSQHHRMILFGGQRSWHPIGTENLNDVWVLDLNAVPPVWSELTAAGTPPEGRGFASLVYDPSGNRVILFGGENDAGARFQDLWSLSLTGTPTWSPLAASGSWPFGRSRHGAIHDPIRDQMVVFGGSTLVFPYYQNDVYTLSLSGAPAWTPVTPAGSQPLPRQGMSVVLDSARDRMLLFGGLSNEAPIYPADVWALNLAGPSWDSLEVTLGPAGRRQHVAAYDPARDRMFVFGGYASQGEGPVPANDFWSLSLAGSPGWTQLQPDGIPDADADAAAVWDIAGDRLVKYGGWGGQNGTWIYLPGAVLDVPIPAPSLSVGEMVAVPNPSREAFDLSFTLPAPGAVRLTVFDVSGRRVAEILDAALPAGPHTMSWNGRIAGRPAPVGVYLARLEHPRGGATTRLLRIR